ncbi:MAG TPA: hypothetical protein EYG68_07900 [Leucothrix mucor]|nr:hypothetical protein [Leucothrix mucor]
MLKRPTLIALLITFLLFACDNSNTPVDNNISPLIETYSTADLQEISKQLKEGMSKEEVEKVLGVSDYSPTDGLYYYSSENSQTLVVDYRNQKDEITIELQSFWLGKVGE